MGILRKTDARKRVDEELASRGILLVEGSHELPSIAGLQADSPGKVGGFSWDSAAARTLARSLGQAHDHTRLDLFRGKDTIVHRRLWPALNAIATRNVELVLEGRAGLKPKKLYLAVQDDPGLTTAEMKEEFEKDSGGLGFGLIRADLQAWLCIVPERRTDTPSTESGILNWYHWRRATISRMLGSGDPPPVEEAMETLLATVPETEAKPRVLFPCLQLVLKKRS